MARESVSLILAERPTDDIIPGKTFARRVESVPTAADLNDGQVLAESLYLSLDPAMRGWIRGKAPALPAARTRREPLADGVTDRRSYMPPVQVGEVMRGGVVSRVLASKSSRAKEGDIVVSYAGWREVAVLGEAQFEPPFPLPANAKLTDLLGVFGTTGLTAYFGLEKIADVKPGETVVVSGAAGATGSIVGQIAKLKGAKVIGIAGTDDKARWLTQDLGFDVALNYKDPDFRTRFNEATVDYIDVYWDNGRAPPPGPARSKGHWRSDHPAVGGEILDMALGRANEFARFVMCGGISQYNVAEARGPKVRILLPTM